MVVLVLFTVLCFFFLGGGFLSGCTSFICCPLLSLECLIPMHTWFLTSFDMARPLAPPSLDPPLLMGDRLFRGPWLVVFLFIVVNCCNPYSYSVSTVVVISFSSPGPVVF